MPLEKIVAHPGGHHLITASGQPFFWLADTAWELFHRTTRAEAEHYLDVRSRQGFNVIQAVILAELDGLHTPNANGHIPLLGDDPTRPNEFYFRYVDELIRLAATKNLYVGLLPTWGDKVHGGMWGIGPVIFDMANARQYGEFLGRRYRDDSNILWILGGDRPAAGYERLWAAMAEGLSAGLGDRPFITYHPAGEQTSSTWLHEQEWLTMNMQQSCHVFPDMNNWATIRADYARQPAKPALDAEPGYEDHPIDPFRRRWQPEFGRFTDYDVRKQAYRAVFAGACGHTYGHHSVWQFWTLAREPVNFPMPTWPEAILRPGATQLIHLKNLVLSRGFLNGVPDQALLPEQAEPPQAVGAAGAELRHPERAAYAAAWRCAGGTFALVYFPLAEQRLAVDLGRLAGPVTAGWYDPRTGQSHPAGQHPNSLTSFTSPIAGPDWVLVLDVTA